MDRVALKKALSDARGEARFELLLKEGLYCLLDDKNAPAAAALFKEIAESGDTALAVQGRLLLGHTYRAMGKRRTAIFTYQRVARLEPPTDAVVMALIALVEIGDATIQRVSKARLDAICASPERPAAADLMDQGPALDDLEAIFASE